MNAKLIKNHYGYTYFLADENGDGIATSDNGKLSKQNCDEIFEVVDVEKLIEEADTSHLSQYTSDSHQLMFDEGFKIGFNKNAKLNKDKVFTEEDMRKAYFDGYNDKEENKFFNPSKSIQQPTEIEVTFNPEERDSEGCLILKRVV